MGLISNITSRLSNKIRRFTRDKSGNIALVAGGSALVFFGIAGMGIDLARQMDAQSKTQAALDGAAMAATAAFNSGENIQVATTRALEFFNKNKPSNLVGNPGVNVEVDLAKGKLIASVQAKIKTSMFKMMGAKYLPIKSSGSADGPNANKMVTEISLPAFTQEHRGEIVFVMDYSGSMNYSLGGEKKYITMRNEAAKLVNSLSQAKTNEYVQFGVVPFSGEVFATMKKKFWYGFTGNQDRASCTRDRRFPFNTTDATPLNTGQAESETKFGQVKETTERVRVRERYRRCNRRGRHCRWRWRWVWKNQTVPSGNPNQASFYDGNENYRNSCGNYNGWRHLEVQNLTDNHQDTYNKILQMRPYGWTHIALGMEFGYHLLSPNAPFTSGVAYGTETTEKAIILLTDGAQTSKAFGQNDSYTRHNGETNLTTLCTNIKASGIRILTISYDLNNVQTENRLKACASKTDDFYNADSRDELVAAFSGITAKLARDMFLAK